MPADRRVTPQGTILAGVAVVLPALALQGERCREGGLCWRRVWRFLPTLAFRSWRSWLPAQMVVAREAATKRLMQSAGVRWLVGRALW
jgi:hypothetical protein